MINKNNAIVSTLNLTQTKTKIGIGVALATVLLPTLVHNQLITGPLINTLLLLTTLTLGTSAALTIGLIPSLIALSRGLLPIALAPAVPFIMVSNAIYILVFAKFIKNDEIRKNKITNKGFALGVTAGSIAKFAFLTSASQLILPRLFTSAAITQKAAFMLSAPQLVTALIGGVIAFLAYKGIKRVH
jgi:riboflavin transporter